MAATRSARLTSQTWKDLGHQGLTRTSAPRGWEEPLDENEIVEVITEARGEVTV